MVELSIEYVAACWLSPDQDSFFIGLGLVRGAGWRAWQAVIECPTCSGLTDFRSLLLQSWVSQLVLRFRALGVGVFANSSIHRRIGLRFGSHSFFASVAYLACICGCEASMWVLWCERRLFLSRKFLAIGRISGCLICHPRRCIICR